MKGEVPVAAYSLGADPRASHAEHRTQKTRNVISVYKREERRRSASLRGGHYSRCQTESLGRARSKGNQQCVQPMVRGRLNALGGWSSWAPQRWLRTGYMSVHHKLPQRTRLVTTQPIPTHLLECRVQRLCDSHAL